VLTFGWRTIAHPLQQLSAAAGAVSGGDQTSIQSEKITGVAEIEDLHAAIKGMVARLESYQAGVLDYLDAMSQGQEEERARLARELHDGPVQSLIALTQRTERAEQQLRQGQLEATRTVLVQLRDAEVAVVGDLRRIIGALRPAYLEDLGFIPALEMLVQSADARGDADVRLVVQDDRRLSGDIELAAYRIAQEALNNALQHAEADTIIVTVQCNDEGVRLQVQDDGRGFTPAEHLDTYTRNGHFGLVGLQERARQLGGSLHVESTPGHGTVVRVSLPEAGHPPEPSR
jgi:two-component system sensor histidine kinase DegS